MKKIYIAGPMSGYPEFNFPAFFAKEAELKAQGWHVFNPANKTEEHGVVGNASYATGNAEQLIKSGWDFRDAYKWDTDKVIEGDAIYMLKGWEASPGARGEHAVAMVMKTKYPEYEIFYE
jgi:hypothetical protein